MNANVYLVTGASDGIGKTTAMALARTGATVIMHGRNAEKLAPCVEEIRRESANENIHSELADYANLGEVAALAERINERFPALNVLINNAGALNDHRQETHDGFELTFGANFLAPFLLTMKLKDTLIANAPARIVNVASTAMGGGVIDFNNLQSERSFDGWQAYANSKLGNVLFSAYLAKELEGSNVVANSLCPGLIDTNFMQSNNVFPPDVYERMRPQMRTPEEGALVPVYLATNAAAASISGRFYVRQGRDEVRSVALNWDETVARDLWHASLQMLKPWL